MINETSEHLMSLVNQFVLDIKQNHHGLRGNYQESVACTALLNRGPIVLPFVAERIRRDFPILETSGLEHTKYDSVLFQAFMFLILDVQRIYGLDYEQVPYKNHIQLPQMDIGRWVEYCELPHEVELVASS